MLPDCVIETAPGSFYVMTLPFLMGKRNDRHSSSHSAFLHRSPPLSLAGCGLNSVPTAEEEVNAALRRRPEPIISAAAT